MRSVLFEDHSYLLHHLHTRLASYRSVVTVEVARQQGVGVGEVDPCGCLECFDGPAHVSAVGALDRTRRIVDSSGKRASASRLAAHCPMTSRLRAPDSTAPTATTRITSSRCLIPRAHLGSGTVDKTCIRLDWRPATHRRPGLVRAE